MRTIIDLPPEQIKGLKFYCERQNISRAEAIRQAVEDLLAASHKDALKSTFGAWKSWGEDSREYIEKLRQEWEH